MADSERPSQTWHPVPRELIGDEAPPANLCLDVNGRFALYYAPRAMEWDEARARIRDKSVDTFWVLDQDFAAVQHFVADCLTSIAADAAAPPR